MHRAHLGRRFNVRTRMDVHVADNYHTISNAVVCRQRQTFWSSLSVYRQAVPIGIDGSAEYYRYTF
jgi:hypothetical protein